MENDMKVTIDTFRVQQFSADGLNIATLRPVCTGSGCHFLVFNMSKEIKGRPAALRRHLKRKFQHHSWDTAANARRSILAEIRACGIEINV